MRVRQREQYKLFDMQLNMVNLQTIMDLDKLLWTNSVNMALLLMGIDATVSGEMTWGDFNSFRAYICGVQTRISGCFSLIMNYRRAIGVARNFATMLRTPVVQETHTRHLVYRTERPQFKERSERVGTDMSRAIRSFLYQRTGLVLKGLVGVAGPSRPFSSASANLQGQCVWFVLAFFMVCGPGTWRPLDTWRWDAKQERYRSLNAPPALAIQMRNVSFHYPRYLPDPHHPNRYPWPHREAPEARQQLTLENVTMDVGPSSHVLIRGPNGCGKVRNARFL